MGWDRIESNGMGWVFGLDPSPVSFGDLIIVI